MTTKIKISILTILLCLLALSVGAIIAAATLTHDVTAAIVFDSNAPDSTIDFDAESGIRWNPGNGAFEIFTMKGLSYLGSELEVDIFGNVGTAVISEKSATLNTATYHVLNDIDYSTELREGSNFTTVKPNLGADGIFDGKGHKLIDFPVSASGTINGGAALFNLNEGTVRNVQLHYQTIFTTNQKQIGVLCYRNDGSIDGCKLTGAALTSTVVGGELGGITYINAGSIENCRNDVGLTAETHTGGITQTNAGTITDCVNNGEIIISGTATNYVGGIAAYAESDSEIRGCTNNGDIANTKSTTSQKYRGGILGFANGTGVIADCDNYGKIVLVSEGNSYKYLGGIVGRIAIPFGAEKIARYEITNCNNYESVSCTLLTTHPGGILGYANGSVGANSELIIQNCTNSGNITGSENVGGIAGDINNNITTISISDCTNSGNILAPSGSGITSSGGIVGMLSGGDARVVKINNCINTGSVATTVSRDTKTAGGIIGYMSYSAATVSVENCTNNGDIDAATNCGGIMGRIYADIIIFSSCNSYGSVTGQLGASRHGIYGIWTFGLLTFADCYSDNAEGRYKWNAHEVAIEHGDIIPETLRVGP